jgi:3-hydroxyisobutyrate dehydrogenase-like beta-hydroxyacid dehydrogenase
MSEDIGLLHPGEMGAAVGACLAGRGLAVLWAAHGRSPATARRAAAAGLTDAGTVTDVARRAGVVLSVCPPHAAVDVAHSVAGFRGIYVDANAVSPQTARQVAHIVTRQGARYVDGGIIGAPPGPEHSTRLYLSGQQAADVAALFAGTAVDARVIGDGPGAASAVKMAYAAWTKGTAALLLAARALARAEGTEHVLLAEWEQSQPGLASRSRAAANSAVTKGWRWVGEMEEIAAAMAAQNLPDGFHRAAAEVFRRSPRRATEMQEPATEMQEPATEMQEPATEMQEPATGTQEPATGTQEPATGTQEPAAEIQEPAARTRGPATESQESPTESQESPTESQEYAAPDQAVTAVLAALTRMTSQDNGDQAVTAVLAALTRMTSQDNGPPGN